MLKGEIFMNEEVKKTYSEIIKNEINSKAFTKLDTPEAIYEYLKNKNSGISEEKFDEFVVDTLKSYEDMKTQNPQLISSTLSKVVGGAGIKKINRQLAAGAVAMVSLLPTTLSATNENIAGSEIKNIANTAATQTVPEEQKPKGLFSGIKKWIKNHPLITAEATLAAIIGTIWLVKKNPEETKEPSSTNLKSKITVDNIIKKLDTVSQPFEVAKIIADELLETAPIISISEKYTPLFKEIENSSKDYIFWNNQEKKYMRKSNISRKEIDEAEKLSKEYLSDMQLISELRKNSRNISILSKEYQRSDEILETLSEKKLNKESLIRLKNYIAEKKYDKTLVNISISIYITHLSPIARELKENTCRRILGMIDALGDR